MECFFCVQKENEKDPGTIRAICVECKMNRLPKNFQAWFYSGQVGPWTVKCYNCNSVLHLHEETNEISSQEATSPV